MRKKSSLAITLYLAKSTGIMLGKVCYLTLVMFYLLRSNSVKHLVILKKGYLY